MPTPARTPRLSRLLPLLACAGLFQLGCLDNDTPGGGGASVGGAGSSGGPSVGGSSNPAAAGSNSVGSSASSSPSGGATSVSGSNVGGSSNPAAAGSNSLGGGGSGGSGAATNVGGWKTGGSGNSGGKSSTTPAVCYSPTRYLSIAYDAGAKGCGCVPGFDTDVCVNSVALICQDGFWQAVEDGPCMPQAPQIYSPDTCTAAGGTPLASPGTPLTAEDDCPSRSALGIIDFASSGWDEGGLCCAPQSKRCGARAGNTCSEREYCAYVEGLLCGRADAESTCKPRPEACSEIYLPICGCDGKTYGNACLAAAAGTGIYASGECVQ